MKNYTITVNGNVYDVTVEEKAAGVVPAAAPAVMAPAPSAVAVPATVPETSAAPVPASVGNAGSIKVEAGAAGKVFKLEVKIGQQLKRGDTVLILEAMKMEIPVVAPEDGTVSSIDVTVGDMVEAGVVMATLN